MRARFVRDIDYIRDTDVSWQSLWELWGRDFQKHRLSRLARSCLWFELVALAAIEQL